MAKLLSELTHYGNNRYLSDVLFYSSERSVEQYKKIRMYPMCWMGLSFLKLGLSEVPPSFESDDEIARAVCKTVFTKIWKKLVTEASEKLDYGWKAFEILWEPGTVKYKDENDNLKTFEGLLIKSPKSLDGETVEILIDPQTGSFRGIQQDYTVECLAKDYKALLFTNCLESGNFYGISAQEPIYPYWYDANINRQFHMRWLERKGTGMFKGWYPTGDSIVGETKTDNQDIMLDLLDGIMEGTHVALPSGRDESGNLQWDIGLLESADKTDPFLQRAKYLDETILRGLVIPEKALTQGEIGARASIESFQNLFITRKQDVLNQIVDTIDRYLLQPFVKLNFGADVEVHVTAGKLDDNSVYVANNIVNKLVEIGKETIDQQWLIDKTGIPLEERPEPEEIINNEGVLNEGNNTEEDNRSTEEGSEESSKDQAVGKGQEKEKQFSAESGRWRALSKREKAFKLSDLDSYLDGLTETFIQDMTAEAMMQTDRILNYLQKNYTIDKFIPVVDEIVIKPAPFRNLINSFLSDAYDYAFTMFSESVEGDEDFAADSASSFLGFRASLTGDKFAGDLEDTIKYTAAAQMGSQSSLSVLLSYVKAAVLSFLPIKLPTLSNVETGFILGKANTDYFLLNKKLVANGTLDPSKKIMRFQYSAILDGAECSLCASLDKTVVDEGSPVMSDFSTPLHYNCRCVWLPITQEDIDNPNMEETDYFYNGETLTASPNSVEVASALGKSVNLKTFCECEI
jgi:hypothetical protein